MVWSNQLNYTKLSGDNMKDYKILITSTIGRAGDIVTLQNTSQTQERLKKGIICELKIVQPEETKAKPKRRTKKAS